MNQHLLIPHLQDVVNCSLLRPILRWETDPRSEKKNILIFNDCDTEEERRNLTRFIFPFFFLKDYIVYRWN